MARHGAAQGARGRWAWSHRHLVIAGILVLVAASVALGTWWWRIVSTVDPIDADPVRATVVVVSSPPCAQGGETTVRYIGEDPSGTAMLDGCGFAPGQRLTVEYLAGDPGTVRKSGTATAGKPALERRLLPIGIIAAGFFAVAALGMLMIGRRRSRRGTGEPISLADLQQRIAGSRGAGDPAAGGPEVMDGPAPPIG